jgi:hypothetical protein
MVGRQFLVPTFAVGLIYLAFVFATAGLAQLQLAMAADHPLFIIPSSVGLALVLGLPLIIASGLIPAVALHLCDVRSLGAYVANAVLSSVLAAYALVLNFGVADNLGAMLLKVPRNGSDWSDGWIYAAPPFADTLASLFRVVVSLEEWQLVTVAAAIALIVGAICGRLYWMLVVRPAGALAAAAS